MADENLFAAVRFNCIGEVDDKIKNLLKKYKAKEEKLLSGSATHAIVTDFDNMESEEARDLWQIPTVTPSWVELSVKCRQLLPTKAFRPSKNLLFFGIVVCPSQLSRSDCCRLWALVTFNGGDVQLNLNDKSTHLVVPTPMGKKYEHAQTHSSVTCVTLDWILNSVKDDKLKDATKYHPRLVIVPPKTPAVSSTHLPPNLEPTPRGKTTPTVAQLRKQPVVTTGGAPTQHPNVTSTEIESNDIPPLNVRNIQQSMISATQLSHQQPLAANMNKEATATSKLREDGDSTQSSDSTSLLPSLPDPKLQPVKQPAKKTQPKKRRTTKAKASSAAQLTKAVASPAVMSPMKPAQHMGTPQQQGNYITQGQQQFNIPPQQNAPPAGQMKMMNLSNTSFSPNYPMGMDTMATGMHGRPRGYTHPQMVQMNQQLQQQIQIQQMHRGTASNLNQFANPQQQQMMNQQMMTQQHLQQQMTMNPRQAGQMFMQQQLPKGSGMMSPQQPNPAIVSSPQQFMTQQQPSINKPPHHAMMMQRMMSANKMPHQQNATHQIPSCPSPFQQSPSGGGMEAISPKALQQGLLIAQQNQRQQQQPLIHPSLQTPQEIPGSPGGLKKRAKPRKSKEGGEAKPRSRGKNTKKTNIPNQSSILPSQPDNNPLHTATFPSPYNVPQPTHIIKTVPQPTAPTNTMDEMLHIKQQPAQPMMLDDIKPIPMTTGHAPVQISASIIEAQLPPLREPFENPLTAIPTSYVGKYHGHDPSENVPKDLCLLGCVFVIAEYEKIVSDVGSVAEWAKTISKYGGIVESDYNSATCTHLMCATQTIPLFRQALLDGKRCVTLYWLNDILLVRELRPPWLIMHIPTPFEQTPLIPRPLTGKTVTYTGFHQKEREQLKRMLGATGAEVTGDLTRNHSVLICKHLISLKSDKAQEWNVPCVNLEWLKDVMEGEKVDVNDEKYKRFAEVQTKLFTLNDEHMKQILDPWKVPVRVTLDCMQRAHVKRKSTTTPTSMPASKRAKVEESYQPLPRVCFTALPHEQVKDLTVKLESLGAKVCDDIRYSTHLVTRGIIRTEKFFSAVSLGQYIVTPDWIEESAKSKWLLDEGKYMLRDKIGEKKFNFSLQESLKRAREQPLFQNYVFCITANVRPNRELLKEIVECAKGKVIKVTPSVKELKRIQRRSDTNNKILIISCPRDEVQVIEWKQAGIPCHNAELVLTGMLKQSIDEVSFQL